MSFIKKLITLKIKPDNNFGRILNKTSRYFAIFGGFILLIAALISIFSIFGRVVFSSPILGDFELVEIACAVAIGSFLPLCHLKNGNVIVDFITAKLPKNKIYFLDAFSSLLFGFVALFFSKDDFRSKRYVCLPRRNYAFSISYMGTIFTCYSIFLSSNYLLLLYFYFKNL